MNRILFVYHVSSIGGGSYCLLNILKSLNRSYVKPYVLLCNNGLLAEEIRKLDIEVLFLPEMRTALYNQSVLSKDAVVSLYHILRSFKSLRDIVLELDVDAVYFNTMMLYPYLKHIKALEKKTIIHIREHWPEEEHKWQRRRAIEHITKYADHIVAINTYSASMFNMSTRNTTIVYDWVDMDNRDDNVTMSEILKEDSSDLKVYLYTGGLQPIKGAIEVIQTFIEHITDPKARLLAVGLQKPLESKSIRGLVKRVLNYFGYRSYSQRLFDLVETDSRIVCTESTYMMTSIIKQSYCFLSYFTIPHANLALAECIVLNTPVIAAETSESVEYSFNGTLACLFPLKDIFSFISQIEYLNQNYMLIKQRLEKYSSEVKEMFDREKNVNVLNNLLKNI